MMDKKEYIEREAAVNVVVNNPYRVAFKTGKTIQEIKEIPSADVAPKNDVAREIVAKFNAAMHSEIARNELLAEYGDDFYEGRIDASLTAIDRLAEIAMEYSEDKNDTE